jgi:hypothetical protein
MEVEGWILLVTCGGKSRIDTGKRLVCGCSVGGTCLDKL